MVKRWCKNHDSQTELDGEENVPCYFLQLAMETDGGIHANSFGPCGDFVWVNIHYIDEEEAMALIEGAEREADRKRRVEALRYDW